MSETPPTETNTWEGFDFQNAGEMLDLVTNLHNRYLVEENPRAFFDEVLRVLLGVSGSDYGFLGEVNHTAAGAPYLKIHAITNLTWTDETRQFYEEHAPEGMEFHNMDTLFGAAIVGNEPVISNSPDDDPRSGGRPPGHPVLTSFLGMPLRHRGNIIGLAGLANRAGGFDQELIDALAPLWTVVEVMIRAHQQNLIREKVEAERDATEQALIQAQKLETLGLLAAGVAHDMNNLIIAIMGNSSLIRAESEEEIDRDLLDESLDEVDLACTRAAALTRQLLSFTRRNVEMPEVLSVPDVLNALNKLIRRLLREDVELDVHCAQNTPQVLADTNQLQQVILNLVVNARDALGQADGGHITVQCGVGSPPGRSESWCRISVSDNGPGILPTDLERVFEPFFTTKPAGEGTGLGLYTARENIRRMGGDLTLDSVPGEGTTVDVWLPANDGEVADNQVGANSHLGGTEKIWLVEDDAGVRQVLLRAMEEAGYQVRGFPGARACLRALNPGVQIDLMVTDVIMPGMRGPELVERIREMRPDLKVLFVSGYTEREFGDGVPMNLNTNFLEKPFTPDRLLLQIRQTLSRSE